MRFRPYSLEIGKFLIKLARKAIETYLRTGHIIEPPQDTPEQLLRDKYGVFTTLETYLGPGRYELRGCIGFPRGVYNVAKGVIRSAIAAATEDPRFSPLTLDELNRITGINIGVRLVEPKSIERSTGKAKRVIDKRNL